MKAIIKKSNGNTVVCETRVELTAAIGGELSLYDLPSDYPHLPGLGNVDFEQTVANAGLIGWQRDNGDWIIEEPVPSAHPIPDFRYEHFMLHDGQRIVANSRPLDAAAAGIQAADHPVGIVLNGTESRLSLEEALTLHSVLSDAILRVLAVNQHYRFQEQSQPVAMSA